MTDHTYFQGRRNRCGWCGQNRINILAKTQPSRVSACSEARTLCNGKEKMTYVVEYVCMVFRVRVCTCLMSIGAACSKAESVSAAATG